MTIENTDEMQNNWGSSSYYMLRTTNRTIAESSSSSLNNFNYVKFTSVFDKFYKADFRRDLKFYVVLYW